MTTVSVSQAQQADAFGLLAQHHLPTLLDATSPAVARAHRICRVLSFRPDIARLGLDPVRD